MIKYKLIDKLESRKGGAVWGHLLVSICACLLTVSIVGSAFFLIWRVIDRRDLQSKVQTFVASLENRSPEELAERAADLKAHPKVAKYVLPEIARTIRSGQSEGRLRAAIEISRAFLDNEGIVKTLFDLRRDPRESIAAAAVHVLSDLKPELTACDTIGRCLADAHTAAARDEACAALYRLGGPGLVEMKRRLGELTVGRRKWLVAYVADHPGAEQSAWLGMLSGDADPAVKSAAMEALRSMNTSASASHDGGAGSAAGRKTGFDRAA